MFACSRCPRHRTLFFAYLLGLTCSYHRIHHSYSSIKRFISMPSCGVVARIVAGVFAAILAVYIGPDVRIISCCIYTICGAWIWIVLSYRISLPLRSCYLPLAEHVLPLFHPFSLLHLQRASDSRRLGLEAAIILSFILFSGIHTWSNQAPVFFLRIS